MTTTIRMGWRSISSSRRHTDMERNMMRRLLGRTGAARLGMLIGALGLGGCRGSRAGPGPHSAAWHGHGTERCEWQSRRAEGGAGRHSAHARR